MKTLRDAEAQINLLKRQVERLEKEVRSNVRVAPETSPISKQQILQVVQQNINTNGIDAQIVVDNNTVLHKMRHIFDQLMLNTLIAKFIDIINAADIAQLHLSNTDNLEGTYFMNRGNDTYISSGSSFDGTDWVARNSISLIFTLHSTDGYQFFFNSGLTPGNTFTPTLIFDIATNGEVTLTNLLTGTNLILSGLNASEFVKTNGSKQLITVDAATMRTDLDVYDKAFVDAIVSDVTTLQSDVATLSADLANKVDKAIYNLSIDSTGNHNHGGAVANDGGHSNSGTVDLT